MFRRGIDGAQRQFFPMDRTQVWEALQRTLQSPGSSLKLKSSNNLLMRSEVSTGMTAMTWGLNLVLQVEPEGHGSVLVISAASKFPAARDRARMMKVGNDLVARVSAALQA